MEKVSLLLGFKVSEFQGFKDSGISCGTYPNRHLYVSGVALGFLLDEDLIGGEWTQENVVARSYRELLVWQKAKALAVHTYRATANFPRTETYGVTSQIRRAVVSVASNIAEGQGRLTSGEFRHFLGQARGSLLEAETQLAIAVDLEFLDQNTYQALERESYQVLGLIDRLLISLSKKIA